MSGLPERLLLALKDRYRIQREIGQGGMATVFLADDVKHDRTVALKVLRPEIAALIGAERFLAEIKLTANLQHPHILPLFDSGEADGLLFYVMPHVAGESLRARLDRERQLPVAEAVRIAAAVANGLDHAHRHGVVHRDIKPGNILLQDGEPVIADFGIALALSTAGGGRLTETGLSLGTPHYMSPEQATGDYSVGAATDIYALGCVLYELLAGEPPFTGNSTQAILRRILTEEPAPVSARRKAVAPNVDHAIRKALERIPADRFTSAKEFALALANPGFAHASETAAGGPTGLRSRRSKVVAAAGWGAAAVMAIVWALTVLSSDAARWINRFQIDIPSGVSPTALSLAPDGRSVVYAADALLRRPLDAMQADTIPGTEGANDVSISPDGEWFAFVQRIPGRNRLKKVRPNGGPPIDITEHAQIRGITWDGLDYLIAGSHGGGLWRVRAAGGTPEPLTDAAGGAPHRYPRVLPGRRGVLFHIGGSVIGDQIAVLPAGHQQWRVLTAGTDAHYVAGHLVYYRDGSLWAAPFDLDRLELSGDAVPVLHGIGRSSMKAMVEWSADGTLFHIEPERRSERLVWVDPAGVEQPLDVTGFANFEAGEQEQFQRPPAISPDGTQLLVLYGSRLWTSDLRRGVLERLTRDSVAEWDGVWSRDGTQVFFYSRRTGGFDTYRMALRGAPTIEAVGLQGGRPLDTTPDGRGLLYGRNGLHVFWLERRTSENLGAERAEAARVSPDGRFIAFQIVDDAGAFQIEARPYPDLASNRWRMSVAGATSPRWSASGRELYYMVDGAIVAVSVDPAGDVPFGAPRRILAGPYVHFDVARDGRFLAVKRENALPGEDRARLFVVQNWVEELKRLVPQSQR